MPRVQQKRGTAASLTSVNPTPLAGELLVVSDENTLVIGNGTDAYTSLAYVTATPRSHAHPASEVTGLATVATTGAYADLSGIPSEFTPAAHNQAWSTITSTPTTLSGYGITDAVESSDARLTDSRTPTAHKASHQTGGSDALSPADIGAAPAASPTFTGDVTIDDKIIHAGDNSAIRFPADDTVTIETAGVERLRVDSSGNVGLGIAPEASRRLAIKANAAGSITGGVLMKSQSTPDGSSRGFLLQCSGTSSDAFVYQFENAPIIFGTNNTIRARIEGNGNVAIGNITPSSLLHVNGVITVSAGSAAAPAIVASGDSNTGIAFATDTLIFSTAGTERVRVGSDGSVAVRGTYGTNTPARMVLGHNQTISSAYDLGSIDWSDGTYVYTQISEDTATGTGGGGAGSLLFSTRDTSSLKERVRVKSTGAVRFVPLAADPASGEAGDVYYNSANNKLRVYDGTSWVDLH